MSHFLFIFLYNTMEIFMKLIAHRGKIEKNDIGNTRQAFQKALSKSYISGIECDVRLTKDLHVVIMHDPVIDFVSDGSGIVKYMTLEELKKYEFNGEPILELEELLQNIHSEKMILIELKGEANDYELVETVNNIIKKYSHLHIVIISFWYPLLRKFQEINKQIEVGLLIGYFLNGNHIYNHFDYNLFSNHYLEKIYMNKKIMFFGINNKQKKEKKKQKKDDVYLITDSSLLFSNLVL